jgi:hypothetical protein
MANTPEQEREEIRDGLSYVLNRSVYLIRTAIVAHENSKDIPTETVTNLIELQRMEYKLLERRAALTGEPETTYPTLVDPPTIEETVDNSFKDTGAAKALFEALFEIANRLQALESKPSITRSQLRDWLIEKASN